MLPPHSGWVSVERFDYRNTFPLLINAEEQTRQAVSAAVAVAGKQHVVTNAEPVRRTLPRCWRTFRVVTFLIGNGGGNSACMIHNPNYDFNDEIIPVGPSYWVKLAQSLLTACRRLPYCMQ